MISGAIVTELIINALKYAFPKKHASARIIVTFEKADADWKVTVADNGVGRRNNMDAAPTASGLGTAIIAALAKQMNAKISEVSTSGGLVVEVAHAPPAPRRSRAAPSGAEQQTA